MDTFTLSAFGDEISPDLGVQMDVLESFGISHIEMRGVAGKNLVEYDLGEVREIKHTLSKRGFALSALGTPFGKIRIDDDFEDHLELFRHALEIAEIMECRFLRMFSFYMPAAEAASHREEVIRRWTRFVDAAAGSGVLLLHENEKGIYGDTAERCRDVIESAGPSTVRATFDPANFVQCGEETFPHAFSTLRDYISQVHIKDALYADRTVVPPGMGDGKVEEILRNLAGSGFDGFLSIEPHLASYPGIVEFESDPRIKALPAGGPREFAVAAVALRRILERIEGREPGGP